MTEPAPLRRPLLLTGPPGAGKTTVAAALAAGRALCAVVEVDDLRHLVRSGGVAPWRPGAGEGQHRLAAVQAGLLASSFTAAGVEVVLCDVVRGGVGEVYAASAAAPFVVALRAPLAVTAARPSGRAAPLTAEEVRALLAEREVAGPVDAEVDATGDPAVVAARVEALWAAAERVRPTS